MRWLILSALLAILHPAGAGQSAAENLYDHLARWHAVTGRLPYRALTSHGLHHAMAPDTAFFFMADGPAEVRDAMTGQIFRVGPSGPSEKPLVVIQPRGFHVATELPQLEAGFALDAESDGEGEALILNPANKLPLPTGRYRALFMLAIDSSTDPGRVFTYPDLSYAWDFTIAAGGEDLAHLEPAAPLPTPLLDELQTIGIGRRF